MYRQTGLVVECGFCSGSYKPLQNHSRLSVRFLSNLCFNQQRTNRIQSGVGHGNFSKRLFLGHQYHSIGSAADIASNALSPQPQPTSAPPVNQVNPAPSSAGQNRPELAESLAALRQGQNEAEIGAKVVKTADEVLGTLIDVTA